MTRTVVVHQPDFLPWIGFFHRLLRADLYVALDHVQFVSGTSRSWTHRDRIKTAAGPRWLSLSVQNARLGTPIREILLAPGMQWRTANLDLIRESYRHAPCFAEIYPRLEALYLVPHVRLMDINLASIDLLSDLLGIRVPRCLSSELAPRGKSNEMVVDLLQKVDATCYLSGIGARKYFDSAPYEAAQIEVEWQAFSNPAYPQLHGGFEPMLSTIDLLFNCGIDLSRNLIRSW